MDLKLGKHLEESSKNNEGKEDLEAKISDTKRQQSSFAELNIHSLCMLNNTDATL